LAKIEGVKEVETDVEGRKVTMKLTKADVDYQSKLKEFAETNEHLEGYSIQ